MKRLFTTIFLLSIGLGLAFGKVISGGTAIISTDQVWTKANSPYRIQDNVLIMENVTLEVEAGVEVIVDATYSLVVKGRMLCHGSESDEGVLILSGVIQHPTPSNLLIEVPFLGQNPVVMDTELSRINDGQILLTLQDDTTRIQDWMLTR